MDHSYGIVVVQKVEVEAGKFEYRLIDVVSKSIHKSRRNVSILRKEYDALILSMTYFDRIFSNPDYKIIFYVDSKVLFSLTKQEGRSPKTHQFLSNCLSSYRPCEFRWIASSKNPADSPSRLVENLDKGSKGEKMLKIMSLRLAENSSLSDTVRQLETNISDHNKTFLSQFQKLTTVAQVDAITRRQAAKLASSVTDETVPVTCEPPENIVRTAINQESRESTDIHRGVGESNDRSRARLYSEIIKACPPPAKNDLEKAERMHDRWHVSATQLVKLYKIPKDRAESIIAECTTCSEHPSPNRHPVVAQRRHDTHAGPNICVSSDVLHLEPTGTGHKYLLVTHCAFSKFTRLFPLKSLDSDSIYDGFCSIFEGCGFPQILRTDGAASYHSARMKGLLSTHNCLLESISPGRSNAMRCERVNREIRDF